MSSTVNKISDENKRKMELTLAQISKRSLPSTSSSSSSVAATSKVSATGTTGTDQDRVEVEVADVKPSLDRSREKGDIDEEGNKTKSNKITRAHYENKKNYRKKSSRTFV